jgi:hypothetical protein
MWMMRPPLGRLHPAPPQPPPEVIPAGITLFDSSEPVSEAVALSESPAV